MLNSDVQRESDMRMARATNQKFTLAARPKSFARAATVRHYQDELLTVVVQYGR